jgi:hypothetical protein
VPRYTVVGVTTDAGESVVAGVFNGLVSPCDSGGPDRWAAHIEASSSDVAERRAIAHQNSWQAGRFDPQQVSIEVLASKGRGILGRRKRRNAALPIV